MANRGIAQRTLGDVSYSGSGGVGDCPRLIPTLSDPRETSGPRIDRIPPARPPWWRRQYRDIKKLIFLTPSKCPIGLFGPLANRTVLRQMHTPHLQSKTKRVRNSAASHCCFSKLCDPFFAIYVSTRVPAAVTHHSFHARNVCQLANLRRYSHTPAFALWVLTSRSKVSAHTALSQHDDHPTDATMGRTAAPRSDERIVPAHAAVACAHALACIHDAAGAARGTQALRTGTLHRRAARRRRDTGVGG